MTGSLWGLSARAAEGKGPGVAADTGTVGTELGGRLPEDCPENSTTCPEASIACKRSVYLCTASM